MVARLEALDVDDGSHVAGAEGAQRLATPRNGDGHLVEAGQACIVARSLADDPDHERAAGHRWHDRGIDHDRLRLAVAERDAVGQVERHLEGLAGREALDADRRGQDRADLGEILGQPGDRDGRGIDAERLEGEARCRGARLDVGTNRDRRLGLDLANRDLDGHCLGVELDRSGCDRLPTDVHRGEVHGLVHVDAGGGNAHERHRAVDARNDRRRSPHLDLVVAHHRIVDLEAFRDRPGLDFHGHTAHLDAIDLDAHLLGRCGEHLDPVAQGRHPDRELLWLRCALHVVGGDVHGGHEVGLRDAERLVIGDAIADLDETEVPAEHEDIARDVLLLDPDPDALVGEGAREDEPGVENRRYRDGGQLELPVPNQPGHAVSAARRRGRRGRSARDPRLRPR